jgi:hypothetical protein
MELNAEVSPAALAELAKVGFDPVFGARPLKRAIQQRIENPLSKLALPAQGSDHGGCGHGARTRRVPLRRHIDDLSRAGLQRRSPRWRFRSKRGRVGVLSSLA